MTFFVHNTIITYADKVLGLGETLESFRSTASFSLFLFKFDCISLLFRHQHFSLPLWLPLKFSLLFLSRFPFFYSVYYRRFTFLLLLLRYCRVQPNRNRCYLLRFARIYAIEHNPLLYLSYYTLLFLKYITLSKSILTDLI